MERNGRLGRGDRVSKENHIMLCSVVSRNIRGCADVYKYANLFPSGVTARRMWGISLKTSKYALRVLILNLPTDGETCHGDQ